MYLFWKNSCNTFPSVIRLALSANLIVVLLAMTSCQGTQGTSNVVTYTPTPDVIRTEVSRAQTVAAILTATASSAPTLFVAAVTPAITPLIQPSNVPPRQIGGLVLQRDEEPPLAMNYSSDSQYFLTVSSESIRIWEVTTGKMVLELPADGGKQGRLFHASLSHDGKYVVTVENDGIVRVTETVTGHSVVEYREQEVGDRWLPSASCSFSSDDRYIASAVGSTVRVWEALTGKTVGVVDVRSPYNYMSAAIFNRDSRYFVTVEKKYIGRPGDVYIALWGAPYADFKTDLGGVLWEGYAVISPDGEMVFTGSPTDKGSVWDIKTGKMFSLLEGKLEGEGIWYTMFSPDSRQLLATGMSGSTIIWDTYSGKRLRELRSAGDGGFTAIWAPDGKSVIVPYNDNVIRVLDLATGRVLEELRGHTDSVLLKVVSPDGRWLATSSSDRTVRLWRLQ